MLFNASCILQGRPAPEETRHDFEIKSILLAGFRPSHPQGGKGGLIRSPLSGAVFMAEQVPKEAVDYMTSALLGMLLKIGGTRIISLGQAEGLFSAVQTTNSAMGDLEVFQEIGKAYSADAVLTGYVYRWREREGTEYAVNRPASVAFDLYLLKTDDGVIIWKGRFEKAQQSLSENLLDLGTFLRSKGRWMGAKELADIGLAHLMETWSEGEYGRKD
jgi:hypothetical protein